MLKFGSQCFFRGPISKSSYPFFSSFAGSPEAAKSIQDVLFKVVLGIQLYSAYAHGMWQDYGLSLLYNRLGVAEVEEISKEALDRRQKLEDTRRHILPLILGNEVRIQPATSSSGKEAALSPTAS